MPIGSRTAAAISLATFIPFAAAHLAEAAKLQLAPCKVPGIEREVRCGTFEVYENRATATGRKIPLRVAVLPATGAARQPDPMIYFNGGPGESAVAAATDLQGEWGAINRSRDILLVDVRGTGLSNGLQCEALRHQAGVLGFLESFLPPDGVRVCRKELETRAELNLYTTALAVDDMDDVRAALGYERVNVGGGSYGSFAALTYLRRHPKHVRTLVIQGIVPPDARLPLHFARDAQDALDAVLAACARDTACHAAFPDPAGDIASILTRLEKEPASVRVEAADGQLVEFKLSRNAAAQSLRYMLYLPIAAARIPLQAHLATQGDFSPLAETAYMFGHLMTDISDGFYLSVTCAEDVPYFTADDAARAATGTFLLDFRAKAQQAACAEWPRGEAGDVNGPLRSAVPVLLISGERDPVTPARDGAHVAAGLTHALHVVVPGGGHGMAGLDAEECLNGIVTQFVEAGGAGGVDIGCVARIPALPFVLADERTPAVDLPPATLERYAGTYAMADGTETVVRHAGNRLEVLLDPGEANALTPVSPTRFKVNGAPPGFFVEFTVQGDVVAGMVLEMGAKKYSLTRKKN